MFILTILVIPRMEKVFTPHLMVLIILNIAYESLPIDLQIIAQENSQIYILNKLFV